MLAENLGNVFELALELAYDCEQHLIDHLPKMTDAACSEPLRESLEQYMDQTKEHRARLEKVFAALDRAPGAEHNPVIRGITGEGEKLIKHIDRSPLLDAVLIMHANQIAHYEIALYESLVSFARTLSLQDTAELLEQTWGEEKIAAEALTRIAEHSVNREAARFQNTPHIFPLV